MSQQTYVIFADRGIVAVTGADTRAFLQGLVSNDVDKVDAEHAVHAAFLTPQGKYLHDFFIAELGGALILDCETDRRADLIRRMSMYRLRADVTIEDAGESYAVAALIGDGALAAAGLPDEAGRAGPIAGGIAFVDPRLAAAGARAVVPRDGAEAALAEAGFAAAGRGDYDALRIGLGLPDGSHDLEVEKSVLLENGFEELNGVDFDKGCYMGQEVTARTKYRGLVKKRLLPVAIDGTPPPFGTPVMAGDREAGVMRSSVDGLGLALLRLDSLAAAAEQPLTAGEARLTPKKPAWASF